jgi:hypothetical protein
MDGARLPVVEDRHFSTLFFFFFFCGDKLISKLHFILLNYTFPYPLPIPATPAQPTLTPTTIINHGRSRQEKCWTGKVFDQE